MCRVERKVQKSVFEFKDRVETTKRLYYTVPGGRNSLRVQTKSVKVHSNYRIYPAVKETIFS